MTLFVAVGRVLSGSPRVPKVNAGIDSLIETAGQKTGSLGLASLQSLEHLPSDVIDRTAVSPLEIDELDGWGQS